MKNIKYLTIIFFLIIFSSCEKVIMEKSPEVDNISIYEEYWKLVNEKFAMFDAPEKNINRTELYNSTRKLVDNTISEDSLFKVLSIITTSLKDGHSALMDYENYRMAGYMFQEGVDKNLNQEIVDNIYLKENVKTQGSGLKYTFLKNNTIGYIQYRDFMQEVTSEMMETILTEFENTKGIILDVRGNGGGDPSYAALMASYFTDKKTYIGYENFKTGAEKDDFSKSEIYLEPADGKKYLKQLIVITNIDCFSATTTLIYHLNPLSNVKFVGSKTGGGSGSVADGYLANGWNWNLSTSEFIDWEGRRLDNGFEPDISVKLDEKNTSKDEIIERAISEIQ